MLKWFVVIVLVVVISGAMQSLRGNPLRLGTLPGDVMLRIGKRRLRLPFTSTLLLSLAASVLFWML